MKSVAPLAITAALILATSALGQTPPSPPAPAAPAPNDRGQALFTERCMSCHEPAIEGAPNRSDLAAMDPDFIFGVLKMGEMAPMAQGLGDDDLKAIVKYLATY